MSVNIKGDTILNVPEQVEKNKNDIIDLINKISDLQSEVNNSLKKASIVNNLDSTATNRPLSANMGKTLKDMISQAIAGVFKYKGSVATYDDLPSSGNVVGDTWNVLDSGMNYCWDGSDWDALASILDTSDFASKSSSNTFTAINIFDYDVYFNEDLRFASDTAIDGDLIPKTNNSKDIGSSSYYWKDAYLSGNLDLGNGILIWADANYLNVSKGGATVFYANAGSLNTRSIVPMENNTYDSGSSSKCWKNVYSFNLSDGTNSLSVAAIAGGIMNVIDANDIVSNTLTQAQYDIIMNGKPTMIKGLFSGLNNVILYLGKLSGSYVYGLAIGESEYQQSSICKYRINDSTLAITIDTSMGIKLNYQGLLNIYGKNFPNFPSNTGTFTLKCVDGVLTWVSD